MKPRCSMSKIRHQDLLSHVELPSRYLGNETNTVAKDHGAVALRFALAFPDLYEIGTSHFGIQILYDILNRHPDVLAERVFAPATDLEERLKTHGLPLTSLETGTPLRDFDIIGFSLLYELNYSNILTMLALSNLPFYASQRNEDAPLVIAGGPCTSNPEPVADFFDAMVIGDGEAVVEAMVAAWIQSVQRCGENRRELLQRWSKIPGVYVPRFFDPKWDHDGFQHRIPRRSDVDRIKRAVVSDLERAPFPDKPIVPYGRPVHDRLRIEVARGCTRGCRFCQAGMIYRPVRERSIETLMRLSETSLQNTGYEDLSLLSLSTGDYSCIAELMQLLMARCSADHVAVSLPSLRAGTLTPEMMALVKQVRKTGFTIAPEAGSQRLRNVINKNISEAEIQDTVRNAFSMGWKVIKLYFMIGLPTETEADLQAIVDLVERLRLLNGKKNRGCKIHVSVATFIPKPHTPFQWDAQIPLQEAHRRIRWLQQRLELPGVQFRWQDPRVSYLEGLWARGDRRLSRLLVAAWNLGCRFDGWSDHFDFERWQAAFEHAGIKPEFFITRRRSETEPLPWDGIDTGVTKTFLRRERAKALAGESTPDCRDGDCQGCGVCDFREVAPKLVRTCSPVMPQPALPGSGRKNDGLRTVQIRFHKTGKARFFGHLEMVNLFQRALRRSNIALKHTQGYHPKPKMAFQDALPLGMESLAETALLTLSTDVADAEVIRRLNRQLPDGLRVVDCQSASDRLGAPKRVVVSYRVALGAEIDPESIRRFLSRPDCIVETASRKGRTRRTDVRAALVGLNQVKADVLEVHLQSTTGNVPRPHEVLRHGLSLDEDLVRQARIQKRNIEHIR
ncbi:MAG TPA: TIGR03960 family B12-binding radical SAM protein [Desulfobacterales bacterium]